MPPTTSNLSSARERSTSSSSRTVSGSHQGPTSNMDDLNLDSTTNQGRPSTLSQKRQRLESQASNSDSHKKRCTIQSKSTHTTRQTMAKLKHNQNSDLEDMRPNVEDTNSNTSFDDEINLDFERIENELTGLTGDDKSDLNDNSDSDLDHEDPEEEDLQNKHKEPKVRKQDLQNKSYAELKYMFSQPRYVSLYGDALLLATWRANFKRMTLDLLQTIEHDQVPEKFRFLLKETIEIKKHEKDLADLNIVDDFAWKTAFPNNTSGEGEELEERLRTAEYKYKDGRRIFATRPWFGRAMKKEHR